MVRLVIAATAMFGFGFALVPFYKTICNVAGINDLLRPDELVKNTQIDLARSLTIEFDANTRNLPWRFRPLQNSISVHPGQLTRIDYEVENTLDRPVTGQAIPSYGPMAAARYFKKLECFCFTKQTLQAKEKRVMPVVFLVDRDVSKDISTITLSYTFFEVAGTTVPDKGRS